MADSIDIGGGIQLPTQPSKTKDSPGTSKITEAPSAHIIVNDSSLIDAVSEKACVILFDWNTFINSVIGADNSSLKGQFEEAISDILDRLGEAPSGDDNEAALNRAINKSLMDFRVTLGTVLGGSSCNFTIENFSDQWIVKKNGNAFYGQSIIQEGIRFTIDARGRFKDSITDKNKFYRIFTGIVNGNNEVSNPLDKRLSFSAVDMSLFLSATRYNIAPAIHEKDPITTQKDVTVLGNVTQGKSLQQIFEAIFNKSETDKIEVQRFFYWKFENENSNFGFTSNNLGIVNETYRRNWHIIKDEDSLKSYNFDTTFQPMVLVWGHTGLAYAEVIGGLKLFLSAFKTKQDILTDLANITFFKSYTDSCGNVHFHPPRFEEDSYLQLVDGYKNDDTQKEHILTYTLFDDDIISQSYQQNSKEVCTVARGLAEGGFGKYEEIRQSAEPNYLRATIAWDDGINRFGFKEGTITTSAVGGSEELLNIFTAAFLLRRNQERFTMSATMIMRPELQPDRPIYDYNKNKVYYIRDVTHTYSAGSQDSGGTYTTSINCNAGRVLGEKISSNLFATAESVTGKSFSEFIEEYASSYNLVNYRSV